MKQHEQAMVKANHVRTERAQFKRRMKEAGFDQGRQMLADAISAPPDWLLSAPVFDVLQWAPRARNAHAAKWLTVARVGWTRRIGDLTPRQRTDIGRCLRGLEELVKADLDELWAGAA